MHDLVLKYRDKYEDLSFREQLLVMLTTLVVLGLVWFLFVYEPMFIKTKLASSNLVPLNAGIAKLEVQKKELIIRRDTDPHLEIKERIALVTSQLENLNNDLDGKFHGLITPKKMARVLESVLKQQSSLKLISVKSLKSEPLIKHDEDDGEAELKGKKKRRVEVYRHGLRIEFEGNYLSALNYLKSLESLQWEFYWDAVDLEVTDYPKARIVITVHTLSLRDYWMGV